jgi:hypothetical protein
MARAHETIRIPRLRGFLVVLAGLVVIGLLVFLQRYRGADRTAMALSMLGGGGLCLIVALSWFQRRWGGRVMTRLGLWGLGLRVGAVAGLCTSGVGVVLLAVRWAIDQQAGPLSRPFLRAFARALVTLGLEMAGGFPAYLAVGAVVGALVGLAVAEVIGISAQRIPPTGAPSAADGEAGESPSVEG